MFNQDKILQLQDEITRAQTIGIIARDNPDLDVMAGALALCLSLSQSGKNVSICSRTEPIVAISSLVGIDKVGKAFTGGNDLTIALPYKQGTIEKISYNIDGDKINLVIKGGTQGLQFDPSEVRFLRTGGSVDLLFAIGISDEVMLEEFTTPQGKEVIIVNIDNSPSNQQFGTMILTDQAASSISELGAHLISQLTLPIDIDIAQNLLSGISYATKNFQDPKTSALAFEMVGLLLKYGAQRQNNFMKQTMANIPLDEQVPFSAEDFALGLPTNDIDASGQQDRPRVERTKRPTTKAQSEVVQEAPPADWLTPKIYKGSTTV